MVEQDRDEKETTRTEAFSDGVFAVAITLLVLELKVPHDLPAGESLTHALLHQWPSYLAFVTSFATIGIMWLNHHKLFTLIHKVDHKLLLSNLFVLSIVSAIPFATAVIAAHVRERAAALLYSGLGVLLALAFNVLWRGAAHGRDLLRRDVHPDAVARIDDSYRFGPFFYLGCVALAFWSPVISLAGNLALAGFFALPDRKSSE